MDRLLVLVPGEHDRPHSFEKNGFLDELAERAIEMDCVAIDANPRYYEARNFAERLHDDLIQPKRQEGYRTIYLLGVARGGRGALLFARRYPKAVEGLILFAPDLGPAPFVDGINAQGGLEDWRPSSGDDELEQVWHWLQGYGGGAPRPPLFLMWGDRDASAVQMTTVEEVLPPESVHHGPGGHDWTTWRALWAELLDRDPFLWIPAK